MSITSEATCTFPISTKCLPSLDSIIIHRIEHLVKSLWWCIHNFPSTRIGIDKYHISRPFIFPKPFTDISNTLSPQRKMCIWILINYIHKIFQVGIVYKLPVSVKTKRVSIYSRQISNWYWFGKYLAIPLPRGNTILTRSFQHWRTITDATNRSSFPHLSAERVR